MIDYKCENCGEALQSPEVLAYDVCPNCNQQNKVQPQKIHWINKCLLVIAMAFVLTLVAQSNPGLAIFLAVIGGIGILGYWASINKKYTEIQILVAVGIFVLLFFYLIIKEKAPYDDKILACLIAGIVSICYLLCLIVLKLQKLLEK